MWFILLAGMGIGVLVSALSPIIGRISRSEHSDNEVLLLVLLLTAVGVPNGCFVFVLDGVLIDARDSRYLAVTGMAKVAARAVETLINTSAAGPGQAKAA